jgi:hypothetical protein
MAQHELAFLAGNDLCAITRGRAMPLEQLDPDIGSPGFRNAARVFGLEGS